MSPIPLSTIVLFILTILPALSAAAIPLLHADVERHLSKTAASSAPGRGAGAPWIPTPSRNGIEAAMAAVIARVRAGADVAEAFQEQGGIRYSSPRITAGRAAAMLRRHAAKDEDEGRIAVAARHLTAACRLSERLGCETSRCLEAVMAEHGRKRRTDDLRRQAFAVPRATIRLLSALPAATVLLGELMGARPLAFLLGAPRGWCVLALGCLWYGAGMVWTVRLLGGFMDGPPSGAKAGRPGPSGDADLPIALAMLRATLGRGASIPGALTAVGEVLAAPDDTDEPEIPHGSRGRDGRTDGAGLAHGIRAAGCALARGATWRESWIVAAVTAAGAHGDAADGDGGGGGRRRRRTGRGPLLASGRGSGRDTHDGTEHAIALIRDCLDEAWVHGSSPSGRLELAIERHERDEASAVERAAADLSVRLLAPTGLCFLPAFILIGVVPSIIAFAA